MQAVLSAVLGVLALIGTPLFVVILAAAMVGFYYAEIPLTVIAIEIYRLVDTPLLIALPLFTFRSASGLRQAVSVQDSFSCLFSIGVTAFSLSAVVVYVLACLQTHSR